MKVIVAETGQVFDSNSLFAKTLDPKDLNELAGEIAHRIQTREMDQILLTKNGIQLKLDTSSNKSYIQQYFEQEDSVVVFNRRLLQNPFTFQPLTIPQPTESLVEFNQILSLKDIKSMIDQQQPHLTRRLDQIHKTILKTSLYRQELIEKYIEEIHAQSIALHAALDNLESHVRTAHQTIDKFDRIAQREFSKHGITLASIDLDIQFLRQVELHPSLMQQQPYLTLDCYVPMDTLQEEKNLLLKTYDDLVNATLGQKNKMTHLIQQTSHMNMNRTTSEIVMDRVTKLQQEICSQWIPTLCSLKPLEQVDLLYDHEDLIYRAEMSIVDEKKMALVGFFKCMQAISQVEESVSRIYPTLAELEKRIKVFRSDLESGKGSMAKKVITGYGLLLSELWRRDKYTEIVTKNASLLYELFQEFGKREEGYRKRFFYSEVVSKDDDNHDNLAILPFEIQENKLPIILKTSLSENSGNLEDSMAVSRGDVESFIRMVHAYYANTADKQHQDSIGCDITHILSRKLDREARRLKKGLEYLGLPGTRKYTAQLPVQTLTNHYHKASPFSSGPTSPTMMASSTMSLYSLNGQKNDWKVGNASTIYQYEQTIEEIKSKHIKEMDQLKKENLILLKEIKSKDSQIQDMREAHQYQLSDLHKQLGLARMDFEKREISLKQEYQSLLDLEKAKYTRRLSHSHERLDAKDKDLAELSFNLMQKQAQSEPNSPTGSLFKDNRAMVELSEKMSVMTLTHASEIKSLKLKHQQEVESLKKAITDQDAYQLVIKELQQKLKNTHAYYSLSLNELKEKQIETQVRMKDLFMAENAQLTIQCQARIDNLITEQQQHVSEITDCLENEKHVLQIEHQAVLHGQTQKINEISQEIHALENKVQHLEKIRAEVNKVKKEMAIKSNELAKLHKEQKVAKHIAKELLSFSNEQGVVYTDDLIDLLKNTLDSIARNKNIQQSTTLGYDQDFCY